MSQRSEPEAQLWLDKSELSELLAELSSAVDRADHDRIAACYTEDSYDDHGTFKGTGREFAAFIRDSPRHERHAPSPGAVRVRREGRPGLGGDVLRLPRRHRAFNGLRLWPLRGLFPARRRGVEAGLPPGRARHRARRRRRHGVLAADSGAGRSELRPRPASRRRGSTERGLSPLFSLPGQLFEPVGRRLAERCVAERGKPTPASPRSWGVLPDHRVGLEAFGPPRCACSPGPRCRCGRRAPRARSPCRCPSPTSAGQVVCDDLPVARRIGGADVKRAVGDDGVRSWCRPQGRAGHRGTGTTRAPTSVIGLDVCPVGRIGDRFISASLRLPHVFTRRTRGQAPSRTG